MWGIELLSDLSTLIRQLSPYLSYTSSSHLERDWTKTVADSNSSWGRTTRTNKGGGPLCCGNKLAHVMPSFSHFTSSKMSRLPVTVSPHVHKTHSSRKRPQEFSAALAEAMAEALAKLSRDARPPMNMCEVCHRQFSTSMVLAQHTRDAHPDPLMNMCEVCHRQFRTAEALRQHLRNIHKIVAGISAAKLPPPVSSSGVWVLLEDFPGKKSFGFFQCLECKSSWYSAHAYREYRQQCKRCAEMREPTFLWKNDAHSADTSTSTSSTSPETKPHRHDLCEACQRAACSFDRAKCPCVSISGLINSKRSARLARGDD